MKKLRLQKLLAAVAAMTMIAAVPSGALAADDLTPDPVKVVALGDDVLASVDGTTTAAEYVAEYFGGTAVNYACVGETMDDLLSKLETDADMRQDVAQADVILLSIGVNDLVYPIWYGNNAYVDVTQYSTLDEVAQNVPTDLTLLNKADQEICKELPQTAAEIGQKIPEIVRTIRRQNSSANLVVQSVNNPLGIDFPQLNTSQNRRNLVIQLYTYMDACLQGGTVTPSISSHGMTVDKGINQYIAEIPGVSVADFYTPYVGAEGEKALGFTFSNIRNLDMTFTPVGQVLLASAAVNSSALLQNGNGSVIAAGYDSTGMASEIASSRASLDAVIKTAGAAVPANYTVCDVNGDSAVDTIDAYIVLNEYASVSAGSGTSMGPVQRNCADADGNGSEDTMDAFYQLLYYASVSAGQDIDLGEFLKQHGRS